jgi:ligand-binding SRPBCC domain-containing protein
MPKNIIKIVLITLVINLLPTNFQVANSTEILWNPSLSNNLPNRPLTLIPGAGIRNTGILVNKSNPDELIMSVIMSESFEDKPFSGKGRNLAMWIYWSKNYCWEKDTAGCEGLFIVGEPFNPSSYPSVKGSEYVLVEKHNKFTNVDVKATTCKAPWWIESTYKSRDTWSIALSITCIGIPKEFGWYAYSNISIGQKDTVTDFTAVQMITYPFHELAVNFGQTSANFNEKSELIDSLKKLSISGNNQSKSLKALIKSTKLSAVKKKTYAATIKSFDNHIKTYNRQISELESLPFGETLKSQVLTFIQSHQIWMKKLTDILGAIIKN